MKLCPHTRTRSRYHHESEQWLQVCLDCGAEQTLQNQPWLDFSNLVAFGIGLAILVSLWAIMALVFTQAW